MKKYFPDAKKQLFSKKLKLYNMCTIIIDLSFCMKMKNDDLKRMLNSHLHNYNIKCDVPNLTKYPKGLKK